MEILIFQKTHQVNTTIAQKTDYRYRTLLAIIFAGEAIFFLPFVLARIFRPTLLTVFNITNTELGSYFSIYGIVAMISYVFGGVLSDKISARKLMPIALWLTSFGGISMAFIPSTSGMLWIYGFWGFTTIFLFWAAMIRATREWGGDEFQGRAFGWLEGGRGLTAAILGLFAFLLFYRLTPTSTEISTSYKGLHAFQYVIMATACITFISGIFIWFFVPENKANISRPQSVFNLRHILKLIKIPSIWLLAVIIVCAYVGYKITDDYSLYAKEVLGFSDVSAAGLGTAALWMRAIVAISAGYLADRFNKLKLITICFGISIFGGLLIGLGITSQLVLLVIIQLVLTMVGVYGVRALYFAIMKEAQIPFKYTGTAVGIVSVIGYTPDVFMSPWMGYLLDKYPGETGHQYVFIILASFAGLGLVASLLLKKKSLT